MDLSHQVFQERDEIDLYYVLVSAVDQVSLSRLLSGAGRGYLPECLPGCLLECLPGVKPGCLPE